MKRWIIGCCLILVNMYVGAQVGIGTSTPGLGAMLDITATGKGVLIPRMPYASRPLSVTDGLLYYQTDAPTALLPKGFWYYDATSLSWKSLSNGWQVTGNAGTNPASHFIGTTDNQPLNFRVNNVPGGMINHLTGNVMFGSGVGLSNAGSNNAVLGHHAFQSANATACVAIGYNALFRNVSNFNVAVGAEALLNNSAGAANTAVGYNALYSNVGNSHNTATGYMSLFSSVGDYNTAMGSMSLQGNTGGNNNTAIGAYAMANSANNYNTAVGSYALANNTGAYNTGVGATALGANTVGTQNAALGCFALKNNSSGSSNTAVGYRALYTSNAAIGNTAIGNDALYNNTGSENTGVGYTVLSNNTTGIFNAALGTMAMAANITGSGNTAVGAGSLSFTVSGSNNTALGYNSGPTSSTLSNTTSIGYSAQALLSGSMMLGNPGNTLIYYYGSLIPLSDIRFKKNVRPEEHGLDFIMKLKPITYNMDVDGLNKHIYGAKADSLFSAKDWQEGIEKKQRIRYSGFSAQQVEEAAKAVGYDFHAIHKPENEHDHYGLDYSAFVVPIVKAMQEQQSQLAVLKDRSAQLEKDNAALRAALTKQQQQLDLILEKLNDRKQ